MEYVLNTFELTKQFKKVKAVNQVSINVRKGEIYGLIGRNGAGKTTFLKMISGLSKADSGEIVLFGKKGKEIYEENGFSNIGTLIEAPGLYPDMTAFQNIEMKCIAYGISDKTYIYELLKLTGLENSNKKKVKNFSLGMKQRLGIALALVGEPKMLVLDEPINGLDPQGIAEIREVILKLTHERGISIIISSHILDELFKIATSYGIISHGQLVEELTKDELLEKCNSRIEIIPDDIKNACLTLDDIGVNNYKITDNKSLHVFEGIKSSADINKALVDSGVKVHAISIINDSLEDYYFRITGGAQYA